MVRRFVPDVLVNGISAKSAGGKSILTNLLKIAREADDRYRYTVLVPESADYQVLAKLRSQPQA